MIAVCGLKNSGKTTLLAGLVERCAAYGLKTAAIKHDGHDFTCDVPETDSYRLKEAGAFGVAVFSENRVFIHKETKGRLPAEELIRQFPEADIVFVEGLKDSSYPKIEVIRKEISDAPVSNPEGRFLIATDWEPGRFQEETADLNDIDTIFRKILDLKRSGLNLHRRSGTIVIKKERQHAKNCEI